MLMGPGAAAAFLGWLAVSGGTPPPIERFSASPQTLKRPRQHGGVVDWDEVSSEDLGFLSLKYEGRDPLRFRITHCHPIR